MNVFNSLGSNYNFSYVMRSLFGNSKRAREELVNLLEEKYSGKAVLTYKGRQALELALRSSNIKKGSGVAVTGFTCIAVVDAIENQNMQPVYVDIDPKTLNFTAEILEKKLTRENNIQAVIIQNTLGYPCDIEAVQKICEEHKLILIEDLAHSIGTMYSNGKEAGTVGDFVALSFSQDKAVDGVSGGAIVIRNSKFKGQKSNLPAGKAGVQVKSQNSLKDIFYPLTTWIIRKTYPVGIGKLLHATVRAFHLLSDPMKNVDGKTMSDWHAKLALDEFGKLEQTLNHRRKIAKIYATELGSKIKTEQATNLRFPIFVAHRDKLILELKRRGVYVSDIWYDSPIAPVKFIGRARYPMNSCPYAESISRTILNLPTHVNVSEKDAQEIARIVNA